MPASHRLCGAALLSALALLAACGLAVDAEQARVCRLALPALNPEGGHIVVERTAPWLEAYSIRVDYRVEREGRPPLERYVICRFAAEGLSANKADLVGLSTEAGPVAGPTVYLLKRFYIDSPEGVAGDPGPGDRAAGLMEVPRPLAYGLQQVLAGLPRTAIYGLLAAAYALVFGLVGRFNLAFGELAALGAAATAVGVALLLNLGEAAPLPGLLFGTACAVFAGAVHAAVGGYWTIARIAGPSGQPSLVATVGLSLALMEYLRIAQGTATVWFPPVWAQSWPLLRSSEFVVSITPVSLLTTAVGLCIGGAVLVLMRRSRFGRAWRAYADDARAAALFGVDGRGLLMRTLALSGALAGLSGSLVVLQYGGLGFAGGFALGLKALVAAVLGGVGSVPGAFLGGLAIGTFETVWSMLMPIDARDIALYSVLIAVLIFRPGGFFGMGDAGPRQV
ncbi:MAG TPA: branched-chain amino acid ABC transporter permease [Beijerinckiaceae bacterium]|jgi:branched-chain amino acid transport system permease protein